jgi:hypothetical protein
MNPKKVLLIVIGFLLFALSYIWLKYDSQTKRTKKLQEDIEFYTDSLNRYTKLYSSSSFSSLKKENKELYRQLKEKEELVEAIKFKYEYEYKGQEQIVDKPIEEDSLYHFNVQNDTLGYDLKIWSTHLQKYRLSFNLTNEFTITRQQVGNDHRLEINSYIPGKIENVIAWNKEQKKSRFSIGPSVGFGYGVFSKKPDIFIGATITYNLWHK